MRNGRTRSGLTARSSARRSELRSTSSDLKTNLEQLLRLNHANAPVQLHSLEALLDLGHVAGHDDRGLLEGEILRDSFEHVLRANRGNFRHVLVQVLRPKIEKITAEPARGDRAQGRSPKR